MHGSNSSRDVQELQCQTLLAFVLLAHATVTLVADEASAFVGSPVA
jgi:hypothetical protein